jgi:ribulose-phosphate 3-epimerase
VKSIIVSPSILSADPMHLGDEVSKVEQAGADWHHIDVMDGHFVPNLTFGIPIIKALKKLAKRPLDVHIMISNPETYVRDYVAAGADILTFHVEATVHSHRLAQKIRDLGAKAGVALNPGTPIETIFPVLSEIDIVMIMSVNPGFGGQSFIQSSIDKIKKLKNELQNRRIEHQVLIEVDGGINDQTAADVVNAGAQILVSGSYIYSAKNYQEAISRLKSFS